MLLELDGRAWLSLDQAARSYRIIGGTPVSGSRHWPGPHLNEPTGFVAALAGMHVDGFVREKAARSLAVCPEDIAVRALSVRLLDHVPQVRAAAWAGLGPLLTLDTAEPVLEILLAGGERAQGTSVLDLVTERLFITTSPSAIIERLSRSTAVPVRRWAFQAAHRHQLLTSDVLVTVARTDRDQWLRAVAADWLASTANPHTLTALLDAPTAEARLVALIVVPDNDLDDAVLVPMLFDRAPRVRAQAQTRARRRGHDVRATYRQALEGGTATPRTLAAAIGGLTSAAHPGDIELVTTYLTHRSSRVRAAAVGAVAGLAAPADAVVELGPLLLDSSPRVAGAVATALARLHTPAEFADPAWASEVVGSRRAAWRLTRAAGSWERVEADIRAATDTDPNLSALGRSGLTEWLRMGAATTWQPLPPARRDRISALLPTSGLSHDQARVLAFHAGIPVPSVFTLARDGDRRVGADRGIAADPALTKPRMWWQRIRRLSRRD